MNRLTGKRGRFRNNLQSKYAEEVSYSIITPHAALAIDDVGVPRPVAMTASMTETVTKQNMKRLTQMADNGSQKSPRMNHLSQDAPTANNSPTTVHNTQLHL